MGDADINRVYLKTANGVKRTQGLITIKIKIFNIEKETDVHIVETEDFENFIIGLDMIKKFKLTQNENLEILQKDETEMTEEKSTKDGINTYLVNFNEHIQKDEFEIKIDHLHKEKKDKIERLIEEYKTVFAKNKYDIGTVKEYEAHIELLIDKYCSKRPYRCTLR